MLSVGHFGLRGKKLLLWGGGGGYSKDSRCFRRLIDSSGYGGRSWFINISEGGGDLLRYTSHSRVLADLELYTLPNINPLFHAWANLQVMSPENPPRTYNPVNSLTHVIQNCLELNHAGDHMRGRRRSHAALPDIGSLFARVNQPDMLSYPPYKLKTPPPD